MKKRAKVVLGVVAACVIGGGGFLLGSRSGENATVADNATVQAATPVSGKVTARSGGSGKAVDGITRVGFTSDCRGAVMAAASYAQMRNLPATVKEPVRMKAIAEVFLPGPYSYGSSAEGIQSGIQYLDPAKVRGDWLAYAVPSCTPEQTADVVLFICVEASSRAMQQPGVDRQVYQCFKNQWQMSWDHGDWKVKDITLVSPDGVQANTVGYPTYKWPAMNKENRVPFLKGADARWQEFDDAS